MSVTTETAEELYTAEDLLAMPKGFELVRGKLVGGPRKLMANNTQHGQIAFDLAALVRPYLKQSGLGVGLSEVGFLLSHGPDTVRAPGLAVVLTSRYRSAAHTKEGYFEGPPDVAVEIRSPSNSAEDIDEKVAEYFAAGARMVWTITPGRRTVMVYELDRAPRVFRFEETLDGGNVLPGFALAVAELFPD